VVQRRCQGCHRPEIETIKAWVDAGAPEGDPANAPPTTRRTIHTIPIPNAKFRGRSDASWGSHSWLQAAFQAATRDVPQMPDLPFRPTFSLKLTQPGSV
jgi:hypothetical protein